MCASFSSTLALPSGAYDVGVREPPKNNRCSPVSSSGCCCTVLITTFVRKSAYRGSWAPRAKLPAVIFATFVVFGNQKSLQRNRNSAICAHITAVSKPRSMPKVELSAFGVVAGEELKIDSGLGVLFASWACCVR